MPGYPGNSRDVSSTLGGRISRDTIPLLTDPKRMGGLLTFVATLGTSLKGLEVATMPPSDVVLLSIPLPGVTLGLPREKGLTIANVSGSRISTAAAVSGKGTLRTSICPRTQFKNLPKYPVGGTMVVVSVGCTPPDNSTFTFKTRLRVSPLCSRLSGNARLAGQTIEGIIVHKTMY
jgi:hypothetical protein